MYIVVRNYLGIMILYKISELESVCSLLGRIACSEQVNPDNIFLIWREKILEQGKFLEDYGIGDMDIISLIPKIKTGVNI